MQPGLKTVTVSALMHEDYSSWDHDILMDLFNDRDIQLIQQILLSTRAKEDKWYWILDNDGEFSVRSCYRKLRGEKTFTDKVFWRKLWNLKLPGKIINFLWRACRNVLPIAEALRVKHVEIDRMCTWCHSHEEDTMHALFTCCFAKELWQHVGLQDLVPATAACSMLQNLKQVFSTSNLKLCVKIGLLCWGLWVRRNKWVWNRKNMSVFGVNAMAENLLRDWERVQEEQQQKISTGTLIKKWCKPPPG